MKRLFLIPLFLAAAARAQDTNYVTRSDNAAQNAAINSLSKSLSSEIKQMSIAIGRLEGTLSTLLK